jgi:hypothetical protein
LGVDEDGEVGPLTLAASVASDAAMLIMRLRAARESYERNPVGRDESSQFWRGLVNRWNNVLTLARRFSAETPAAPIIISPSKPTGNQMPPAEPTKYNAAVEDALAKFRPILEEFVTAAQLQQPTVEQMQDDIIRRFGGTPPKRSTVPLITGPSGNVGGTAAPAGAAPAAPSAASTSTASTVMKNAGVGGTGLLGSALAAYFGVPMPTAVGVGGLAGIVGLLGGYAPLINGAINAFSAFRAGRAAQKAQATP